MKKLYFISLLTLQFFFLFNLQTIHAQWISQTSPAGTGILGKMQFVSATEGWIVCGSNGNLLHTTNAGNIWSVVTPFPEDVCGNPSDVGLTMSWPNASHGWALKTYEYNNNTNTANGAVLYQTTNGGLDWTKKDFPKLAESVVYSPTDFVGNWQMHGLSIDKPDDDKIRNGWVYGTVTVDAAGSSVTVSTNNQNQISTRNSPAPTITSKGIASLSGTDMHGFMSANKNLFIYTQSAGEEGYFVGVWQKMQVLTVYSNTDLQGTWALHSIQTNDNAAWLHGTITMNANGIGTATGFVSGNNPFEDSFSSTLSSLGIYTVSGKDVNGFMSADKQTIFMTRSQNGGYCLSILQKKVTQTTYSVADMVGVWQLHSVKTSSASSAWAHGQYDIKASGDVLTSNLVYNNEVMSNMNSSILISSDGTLTDFSPSTDANGFLSIDKNLAINTLTDGQGGSMLGIIQKDHSSNGDCGLQVQFADNNTGWASVYNGIYGDFKLYKTTNGGSSWDVINGITNPVGGFYYFVDALNGWMFGASDTTIPGNTDILHTTNGGLNWTTQVANVGSPTAIHFSDTNNGWIVGYNGLVMHTTNGGADWTSISNSNFIPNAKNRSVFAINANVCCFLSKLPNTEISYVFKTIDGGGSWTFEQIPQSSAYCLYFWDEHNGWVSGDDGQIAHYSSNTGVQNPINDERIFAYPNPTKDFVTIANTQGLGNVKIYDISGNCVLDKQIVIGNKIDVRILAGGIYFIKLQESIDNKPFKFIKN